MNNIDMTSPLETKVATGVPSDPEISSAMEGLIGAFEAFKQANDQRLGEIEQRMSADVVTLEKVERINSALDRQAQRVDELVLKNRRPQLVDVARGSAVSDNEHKSAFEAYVRKGQTGKLSELEAKSLSIGTDADGGYLVPDETEAEINRLLKDASAMRAISDVRQVSSAVYKKPFAVTGAATGWAGETAVRPETDSPTLAELQFPTMELYAMPAATQALLDDSAVCPSSNASVTIAG